MHSERSAGVVLFREESVLAGGRVYLVLDYGRYWDYPKGHVEKGEDDATAALRELAEETGIHDAQLVPGFEHEMTYFFRGRRDKALVRKTVAFFLARTSRKRVTISHEHVGYAWLAFEDAVHRLTYANAKAALRAAHAFLAARERSDAG